MGDSIFYICFSGNSLETSDLSCVLTAADLFGGNDASPVGSCWVFFCRKALVLILMNFAVA